MLDLSDSDGPISHLHHMLSIIIMCIFYSSQSIRHSCAGPVQLDVSSNNILCEIKLYELKKIVDLMTLS